MNKPLLITCALLLNSTLALTAQTSTPPAQTNSAPVNPNQISAPPLTSPPGTVTVPVPSFEVTSAAEADKAIAEARELIAQARKAYPKASIDQNLWRQAAEKVEAAVKFAPQHPEYLKLRAELYTEVGFWYQAGLAWEAYFKVAPQGPSGNENRAAAAAQYNLGYAAYTRQLPSQAAGFFNKCLEFDPQNVLCATWAARTALEAGEYAKAQGLYAQAQKLNPNDKTLSYFALLAQKAATYGPASTKAFSQAYAELEAGRKAQALAGFQEAARSAPNFIEAWREAGRLALELGDAKAALAAYQGAVALPGASASDKYNLGLAQEGSQYGLGVVQGFRAAYNKYVAGDKAAAEAGFLRATTQNPGYAKAWAWLGRVRYEARNFSGAVAAYEKAVQLDPNDKSSQHFLKMARQGR